ncbi:MAG: Alcohol dehydrogenase (quinone), cytochrome c subunit [Myxococcota bacterium]|nr:Alcohol dehydrogenase (quinone), cytochrome c subunit [Myxococcota bacterium]
MKTALKVVLGLVALVLVGVGSAVGYVATVGIPTYEVPQVDVKVEVTPARVERGKRFARMLCAGCHLAPDKDALVGRYFLDLPKEFGDIWSKNITQHPEYGIGKWTDSQLVVLLRTGIRPDGTWIPPYMPKLVHVSDEDVYSIIAFLRSDDPWVKPQAIPNTPSKPSLLTKLLSHGPFKAPPFPSQPIVAPPASDQAATGKYLAFALDCYTCHSKDFKSMNIMEPEKSEGFMGGGNTILDAEGNPILSPNITMDEETGIGKWTEDQFVRALKHGVRPDGQINRYPMEIYSGLTDDEAKAIHAYLRTVPKLSHKVDRSVGPRQEDPAITDGKLVYQKYGCAACHGMTGMGICDLRGFKAKYPDAGQLVAFIKKPQATVPDSRMPAWDGVIKEAEYAPLLTFLETLSAPAAASAAK